MVTKNNEDDIYKRRKKREAEDDSLGPSSSTGAGAPGAQTTAPAFDRSEREARQLIEQLNALYQLFFNKAELRPPMEKRKKLDDLMKTLSRQTIPGTAAQFKFGVLRASYQSHCERWDRAMKLMEAGKPITRA